METVITFAVMFDDASGAEIAHFSFYIEKTDSKIGILILRALESHGQIAFKSLGKIRKKYNIVK